MRVAISKGTLQVPPTYFAVQHAVALAGRHDFRFFTGAAHITDPAGLGDLIVEDSSRNVPVLRAAPFTVRDRFAPFLTRQTSTAIQRWQPDLIHQHFATLSGGAVRAHRRTTAPLIITVHGADIFVQLKTLSAVHGLARARLQVHHRGVQRAFNEADRILAVSEYLADRAVAAGADPAKVTVHYQGIDTERYRISGVVGKADLPQIAFVGALTEAKGVRDLIRVSVGISRDHPHRLVLVGEGPLRIEAQHAAAEHPHIHVLGSLPQEGVREVLARSSVLALPTKRSGEWREAAGLVTLEAQSMRIPVVVYDSGGAKEMLVPGETGLLVAEGDLVALEEALRSILELSEGQHSAMGERARAFVVEHRSLAHSAEELCAHYEELSQ